MLKNLDNLLALLPFNGDKLKLSGLILLIAQLPVLVPGLDLKLLVLNILENPTKAGVIAAIVAVVHKVIKAQLPQQR